MNWRKTLMNSAIRTGMYLGGRMLGNYLTPKKTYVPRPIITRNYSGYKRTYSRRKNFRRGGVWRRNVYRGVSGSALKYFDVNNPGIVISNAGTINADRISPIPQGTGPTDRIGQRIVLKKFLINGWVELTDAGITNNIGTYAGSGVTPITNYKAIFMLILDRQANGAVPAPIEIQNPATFNVYNNLDNVDRFVILKKWSVHLKDLCQSQISSTNTLFYYVNPKRAYFKKVINLNHEIIFSANFGALTEIRSNNIFLYMIGSDGVNFATCSYRSRVRFQDKMQ